MKKAVIKKKSNEDGKFRLVRINGEYQIEFQSTRTRGCQEREERKACESEAVERFDALIEKMAKIKTEKTVPNLVLGTKESAKKHMAPKMTVKFVKEANMQAGNDLVTYPKEIADMLLEHLQCLDCVHFLIVLLNTKNKIIGVVTISIGSLNATIVHPREVFKPAILSGAASMIITHNHPSGDPEPSQEDLQVTRRLIDVGNIIGIAVRDHVIIGDGCFFSFREKGLM